ncbi:hypothetical protein M3P19_12170 [Muricauda sp. 2012CJ35-5]|uniref:Uncharacterized protein n=1 Tax=Flagellimonas spongiicola TaxID=2942208 RepID=A0ABT0PWB4_9FLAO|nr:hypothetical protein [Allomuricauda spongiicola]MCL6274768.1 hypothetical protein [Allomuricauda spongiicola]
MKKSLALILFFIVSSTRAEFVSMDILTMTLKADSIVAGEITCVDNLVYELEVSQSIGQIDGVITIRKFNDWACAVRWTDYFVGEQLLAFLVKDKNGFRALGAGNEGELPILKNNVYPSLMCWSFDYGQLKKLSPHQGLEKTDSIYHMGIEVNLGFLWRYLDCITNCFEASSYQFSRVKSAHWTCSEKKVLELRNSNKLIDLTFEKYPHITKDVN